MRVALLSAALLPVALLAGCTDGPTPIPTATPTARASDPAPAVSGLQSVMPAPERTAVSTISLTGSGIDLPSGLLAFGTSYRNARGPADIALGRPTLDTDTISVASTYGTCPGTDLRVLEYAGGALKLFFGTLADTKQMSFYGWSSTNSVGDSSLVPPARARLGSPDPYAFGPGTTVAQLRAGTGKALTLPSDERFPPGFRLTDGPTELPTERATEFRGTVTGLSAPDTVQSVSAGQACGE